MSVSMKMRGNNSVSIEELREKLVANINSELVLNEIRGTEEVKVTILVFEKYFIRNNSTAGLFVTLVETKDFQTADIVSAGAGSGLFNISWGADQDLANLAVAELFSLGFELVD